MDTSTTNQTTRAVAMLRSAARKGTTRDVAEAIQIAEYGMDDLADAWNNLTHAAATWGDEPTTNAARDDLQSALLAFDEALKGIIDGPSDEVLEVDG